MNNEYFVICSLMHLMTKWLGVLQFSPAVSEPLWESNNETSALAAWHYNLEAVVARTFDSETSDMKFEVVHHDQRLSHVETCLTKAGKVYIVWNSQ